MVFIFDYFAVCDSKKRKNTLTTQKKQGVISKFSDKLCDLTFFFINSYNKKKNPKTKINL
jgi:hypothetical protein